VAFTVRSGGISKAPEVAQKFGEKLLIARHRFGDDDIRSPDQWPLGAIDAKIPEGTLRTHPERQLRNLGATRVDVDAVEIVAEDQLRHRRSQIGHLRVILLQSLAGDLAFRGVQVGPCLLIDADEKIEAIEQEMSRAAGGIEDLEIARVLLRAGFPGLIRLPDEVLAALGNLGIAVVHLVPDAAEGILGQELNDIAGREKLVADGELSAVAWRRALIAHLLTFFAAIEELVDPANRLILGPNR
jgi:hypothetical protein